MYSVRLECPQLSTKRSRPGQFGFDRVRCRIQPLEEQVGRGAPGSSAVTRVAVAHFLDRIHGENPG